MNNDDLKRIKQNMDYLRNNGVYLFINRSNPVIRFSDKNQFDENNEIIFSKTAYTWQREELRSLISYLEIEKIIFPDELTINDISLIVDSIAEPFLLQLKTVNHNYKNKLFYIMKLKDGWTAARYKLLKNQKYICFARMSDNLEIEFYSCDKFENGIRTFENFIPVFTSTKAAEDFSRKNDISPKYELLLFNYKRIEKFANKRRRNICINCTSPIIKNKDFSYFVPFEMIRQLIRKV